jgi:hypothetical protein
LMPGLAFHTKALQGGSACRSGAAFSFKRRSLAGPHCPGTSRTCAMCWGASPTWVVASHRHGRRRNTLGCWCF